ncbi:MAG TPA: response regulator [Dehalococcoidia bacterium]|nr:response regulator [Dehalococcoidia bacterium]
MTPPQASTQEVATAPRILVIDDDRSVLRAIRLTLILDGFEVETASDGLEGLDQLNDADFDLVVLDLQMPGMDGRTCFREMRSRGYEMPVLIISAYGAETARAELQADGAVGKPFDPDMLVEKIRSLLPATE